MRDFSNDISKFSLNTATLSRQWSLEECIDGCSRHGIRSIAPWRDKLQECGVSKAAKLIRNRGLEVSSLCRGGFFTLNRNYNLEDNYRAVDEAAAIGAHCLILVVGGLAKGSRNLADAHKRVEDGLGLLHEYALKMKMPLAIEPLHPMYAADRACINDLDHAMDLCEKYEEGIGVAIDVYHVWWDPYLERKIIRCRDRILGYHICDWLVPTSDMLRDRGMMGDGIIELKKIRKLVEEAGYNGYIETEIFSENNWWKRNPDEVLETCLDRFRTNV